MIHTETSVTRWLEQWASRHLGNHESEQYHRYIDLFRDLLGAKRAEQGEAHDNKGVFGMASVAGCMRNQALKRAGVKGLGFSGSELATFEIGHLVEVMTLAILQASGFQVETHQEVAESLSGVLVRRQIEASLPPAHYSYADAILRGGPVDLPYPLVLSVKSMSYKSSGRQKYGWKRYGFAALPLDGLHESQTGYWVQAQLEMAALDLQHALVVIAAKDMIKVFEDDEIFQQSGSLTWYAEVVPRAPEAADIISAAYARILTTSDPMSVPPVVVHSGPEKWFTHLPQPGVLAADGGWLGPNAQATGKYNPCRGCWYAAHCRGEVKDALVR